MTVLNISVPQLLPGMIVAEDVYSASHYRILEKNTMISPKSIDKLKIYGIKEIIVFIPKTLADKIISASTNNKAKETLEFKKFKKYYLESIEHIKLSFTSFLKSPNKIIDPYQLLESIDILLQECSNSMHTFDMLHLMRDYDDITYVHSLNVSLICNSFGSWLHYSPTDIKRLTLAGLLHDIGKLKIPTEIISKPSKLTPAEYEIVKKHPALGYEIIKNFNIDEHIKAAVLMHHERCDGTGYPYSLANVQIDPLAKIVAIADVYDAMTATRVYRKPICPFDVVAMIEEDGYQKYDPAYLIPFLEQVVQSYIGTSVLLTNALIGDVVMINKSNLSKPIVKVQKQFLDLSKMTNIKIKSIV